MRPDQRLYLVAPVGALGQAEAFEVLAPGDQLIGCTTPQEPTLAALAS
jgi:hypothetical protein